MCWIMAPTILRVSWKIVSSSQAEFTLWSSFAMRLCSRSSKTWMDVTAREGIKNDVRIKSSIKQELRERNPEPTDNYLKSIFSTGNHFLYFEPRSLQVLFVLFFCLFVLFFILLIPYALWMIATNLDVSSRKAPTQDLTEDRISGTLFLRGAFEPAWI